MGVRYVSVQMRGDWIVVLREIILKTGEAVLQSWSLSPETFSLRAGEYGLDVEKDEDTVWDVLMHEMNMDDDEESPLLTAETLEEARDRHLARIIIERDKLEARQRETPWTDEETRVHKECLATLRAFSPSDPQLAELSRMRMKGAVKAEKKHRAKTAGDALTSTQKMKTRLIDDIRQQGDADIEDSRRTRAAR